LSCRDLRPLHLVPSFSAMQIRHGTFQSLEGKSIGGCGEMPPTPRAEKPRSLGASLSAPEILDEGGDPEHEQHDDE
jgi:hypothetical protein